MVAIVYNEFNVTFKVTDRFTHLSSRITLAEWKLKSTWQAIKLLRIIFRYKRLLSQTSRYRNNWVGFASKYRKNFLK